MGRMIFSSSPDSLQAIISSRNLGPASVPAIARTVLAEQAAATSRNVFQPAQHRNLAQPRADHAFVHGEQSADAIGQFAIALDLAGKDPRGVVAAHQQRPAEVARIEDRRELLSIKPPGAASAQRGDRAKAIHYDHDFRHGLFRVAEGKELRSGDEERRRQRIAHRQSRSPNVT